MAGSHGNANAKQGPHDHNAASPQLAIGLTFFAMFATILGATLPLIISRFNQWRSKKRASPTTDFDNDVDPEAQTTPDTKVMTGAGLSDGMIASFFGFGAGSLIFASLYHILPHSASGFASVVDEKYVQLCAMASFIAGVVLYQIMLSIVVYLAPDMNCPCHHNPNATSDQSKDTQNLAKCHCSSESTCGCTHIESVKKQRATSWMALLAMSMHHIPEGLIFYISAAHDLKAGVVIGLVLLIHSFPEGLAIGCPTFLAYPDQQQWRPLVYGAVAGAAHPLGAVIAWAAFRKQQPNEATMGVVYGVVSGLLLAVSFRGLLNAAREYDLKDRFTTISTLMGALLIFFSIGMFGVAGFH